MSKIFTLSKTLANQIAAGEVVERPVSVVKELVENAVDAGATDITVEIKNGGMTEIIVSDNGSGMEEQDILIATDKYTTSKIQSLEDLYRVMTFGFRGEALASIASVSELSLISKTESMSFGKRLAFEGEKKILTQFASETGTKIEVRNLFYNTPARLNYLKTEKTEYAHISEFLSSMALVEPEIAFSFIADGKKVFSFHKNDDVAYRVRQILGADFSEKSIPISFSLGGIEISGVISDPKGSYTSKNRQHIFVNKRGIKSPIIYKAMNEAYNRFIPHGSFPAYVLFIDLDPTVIDVNVHPRKTEIRFADEKNIFRVVYNAVNTALERVSLVSNGENNFSSQGISLEEKSSASPQESSFSPQKYYIGSGEKFKNYSPYKDVAHNPSQMKVQDAISFSGALLGEIPNEHGDTFEKSFDVRASPVGKILGQAFNSYIVVETENSLQFLDQHALAERIIYEKLCKNGNNFSRQKLLFPESIDITAKEESILHEYKNEFESMGFEYEIVSGFSLLLSTIPDFIKKENVKEIFSGIISDVESFGKGKSNILEEVKNKIRAYTACRSAVKFGDPLSIFEIRNLLQDAIISYSSTCPHGRPVVFEIGIHELKGKFER